MGPSDQPYPEENASDADPILYERREAVAVITLNRPRLGNAQNYDMLYALDAAFMRAIDDDAVGAVVLCGAGKHFSSGHDLSAPKQMPDNQRKGVWYEGVSKPGAERRYAQEQEVYLALCRRWRAIPKPTVAAVQGACVAGGLMLAWVCDLIVASEEAYFCDPVVAMGIPGVEYFAHAFEMPSRIAREFLMLGEKMSARRAYEVGMVNRVVPPEMLLEEAMKLAARMAARPRFALALTKQAFNFIDDAQGRRTGMDGVFAMHHLAHSHNDQVFGAGKAACSLQELKKSMES